MAMLHVSIAVPMMTTLLQPPVQEYAASKYPIDKHHPQ
jgi:hypothetical protein